MAGGRALECHEFEQQCHSRRIAKRHRRYLWRLPTDLRRGAQLVSERLDPVRAAIPVQHDRQAKFLGEGADRPEIRDAFWSNAGRLLSPEPPNTTLTPCRYRWRRGLLHGAALTAIALVLFGRYWKSFAHTPHCDFSLAARCVHVA